MRHKVMKSLLIRKATKKDPPLVVRPLRGGGGVEAGLLKKKNFY